MVFQKNVWYVAALSDQVDRTLQRRVIIDMPVLLYRQESGHPAAMLDRCPHRFAPLSRGKLDGDVVECGYHGLRFNSEGRCVFNPDGKIIAPNMHLPGYPVVERYGYIWIWLGDQDLSNPDSIPDLSHMTAPDAKTVHNYLKAEYRYDILVDNLLDLSHAQYLHLGSFSGGPAIRSEQSAKEVGDDVIFERTQYCAPAAPRDADLGEFVDQEIRIHWHPGQVMTFRVETIACDDPSGESHIIQFGHITTPESADITHYFMSGTRHYSIDDVEVDEALRQLQLRVVGAEDCPMLEAIHSEMKGADLMSMRPVVLPADLGALRVRKVMKRLLQNESDHLPDLDVSVATRG